MQEQDGKQKELNKDFTTMVMAIEMAQEAGGVYKTQDAAVVFLAQQNLAKFIQRANTLIEQEQERLKKEMEVAEPVEKAAPKKAKTVK